MELRSDVKIQIERWISFNYDFCPFVSTFEWNCKKCTDLLEVDIKVCPYKRYGRDKLQNILKRILSMDKNTGSELNDPKQAYRTPYPVMDDEEDDFYI